MRQHKRGVAAEVASGNYLEEQPPPTHAKSVALVDIIGTLSAISISRSAGNEREKNKETFPATIDSWTGGEWKRRRKVPIQRLPH